MLFTQVRPNPPLAPWITAFWHLRTPVLRPGCERVLPSGCAELILNLAADHLVRCDDSGPVALQAPALLHGVDPTYTVIRSADLAELMGVVFAPGALPLFFTEPAHLLKGEIDLELLWGHSVVDLRDCLRETPAVKDRFAVLSAFLERRLKTKPLHPAVLETLDHIRQAGAGVPTCAGLSERRTRQLFTEAVGVGPKAFTRIRRFRQACERLHRGDRVPWAQMALALGYFDQAHFNADFRAFSGLCPSAYLRADRPWSGHVQLSA